MVKKSPSILDEGFAAALADRLADSRKYRRLALPRETLLDLITKASRTHSSSREIEEIVRRKLHNLVAPYLGEPDYVRLQSRIADLSSDLHADEVIQFCLEALNAHASTRERVPINAEFYSRLFSTTSTPAVILDLACGMNPFALPWMNLPPSTQYFAYDLHQPRVDLINAFFRHFGQAGCAIHQDILLEPPADPGATVLFFKEAHRFEQRETGCVRSFLQRLASLQILLSLPVETLSGSRSMLEQDRRLVAAACVDTGWQVSELLFSTEIVFFIRKDA